MENKEEFGDNEKRNIIVYQHNLFLGLRDKALELSVRIEYLTLEEDALGVIDFISVHSCE